MSSISRRACERLPTMMLCLSEARHRKAGTIRINERIDVDLRRRIALAHAVQCSGRSP
jgi:hypothetical protein